MGCKYCDDEIIGDGRILICTTHKLLQNTWAILNVALHRPDRWAAELRVEISVPAILEEPILIASRPINYCPMCGRRLSLGDAGRRQNEAT